jgi:hypothetical protein
MILCNNLEALNVADTQLCSDVRFTLAVVEVYAISPLHELA